MPTRATDAAFIPSCILHHESLQGRLSPSWSQERCNGGASLSMPTLITGTYEKKRYTLLRWGSHISIMWMLALLFIVPHDPSTRLSPMHASTGVFSRASLGTCVFGRKFVACLHGDAGCTPGGVSVPAVASSGQCGCTHVCRALARRAHGLVLETSPGSLVRSKLCLLSPSPSRVDSCVYHGVYVAPR